MIISFKYKFIFIKTFKTGSSSIENYLYPYLNSKDILAPTEDYRGINCWGNLEAENLKDFFPEKYIQKKIKLKLKYFAHMPIWLVKKNLESLSIKLNKDIFNDFYKFGVVRNPLDTILSYYHWRNNPKNPNSKPASFNYIINEIKSNTSQTYGLLNLNKLMDQNLSNVLCDKVIKYEELNEGLDIIFNKLGIPFNGKLDIYKKRSNKEKNYEIFDIDSKKLIRDIFWKEIEMLNYKL